MYLLLGNTQMEKDDCTAAIQSFEHGQAQLRHYKSRTLFVVSLVAFLIAAMAMCWYR